MIDEVKEKRMLIEQQYLSLLLNETSYIQFATLKPVEFMVPENKVMYDAIIKSYKETKSFSVEYVPKQLFDYWTELLDGYYERYNATEMMSHCEQEIENFYKEEQIIKLSKELELKRIDYKEFLKKLKELEESTTLVINSALTEEEIRSNIQIERTGINFKSFQKLSQNLKLLQNDLLVVGASTGVGKSGFLLNLMNDLMNDYQCIYFNLEMSKSNIYRRMIAINQNFAVNSIDNPSERQQSLINKAIENIKNAKLIVNHSCNNILDIKKVIKSCKDKNKHTVVFIDHIGLLKYQTKKSIYEESTEIMKELRKICLEYNCTIIAASQLNRSAYDAKEVTLNMLKDSGELENSARKIILISYQDKTFKDSLEPIMNIDIAKNDNGRTGMTTMKYLKVRQVFSEDLVGIRKEE